jgi:hypothetical protein
MRVLICGGRNYTDVKVIRGVVEDMIGRRGQFSFLKDQVMCVIHGAAKGADSIAGKIAAELGIAIDAFPANWKKYGRAAGPIRNQQMIDEGKPDLVVAFPGGAGTANMIRLAERAGVKVIHVAPF